LLSGIEREYSLYEIAIATRAGQAKALGFRQKGHLGVGADADIAVYNINPNTIDPSKEFRKVRRAFERSAYTIKDGRIVVKDGSVVQSFNGKTFWVNVKTSSPMKVTPDLKQRFRDYWTVEYENYFIPEDYLAVSAPVSVESEV
jgi:formylmethanofuran dehydrogenase subunit A